jgi:hypothetical protein
MSLGAPARSAAGSVGGRRGAARRWRRLLDLDRAVSEHGRQRTERRRERRDHGPDDAYGQRKFGDHSALLLDEYAADVAFVDQPLDLRQDLLGRAFDSFSPGAFHWLSSRSHTNTQCALY